VDLALERHGAVDAVRPFCHEHAASITVYTVQQCVVVFISRLFVQSHYFMLASRPREKGINGGVVVNDGDLRYR
jgi:hypothetical protein